MFTSALQTVLFWEGGYTNDPHDPGGETNLGISKRAFPNLDIKGLTVTTASQIYRAQYWIPCRCDELPDGLDLIMFDCAVNQGVDTAKRILQEVAGVTVDGKLGAKTMAAVKAKAPTDMINAFTARRIMRYSETKGWGRYGKGWISRVVDVHQKSLNPGGVV